MSTHSSLRSDKQGGKQIASHPGQKQGSARKKRRTSRNSIVEIYRGPKGMDFLATVEWMGPNRFRRSS